MTPPRSPYSSLDDSSESMADWFQQHGQKLVLGVIALAAVVGGGWFYNRSQDLKNERAERAYFTAQRALASGNLPLAESDLKKMVTRYEGTNGAIQGRLLLARTLYEQNKYQEGIQQLLEAEDEIGGSAEFGSSAHLVLAAGYEQLKKFAEAAAQYEKAAKVARFDADRQRYESFAARAYLAAGRPADAKRLWTPLAADSKSVVAGEARVRLGEMTAKPQPRS